MAIFDKGKLKDIQKKEQTVKKNSIMIVDDEQTHLNSMASLFSDEYEIITALDGQEAFELIRQMNQSEPISLIISDQRMPKLTGIQLFEKIKDILPNTIRIILTAYDEKGDIIASINKAKIHEFILKPFEPEDLKIRVKRAIETFELKQKVEEYQRNLEKDLEERTEELILLKESFFSEGPKNPEHFKNIITESKKMMDIFKYIEAIAEFNVPVLITGETGTGKELIARAIHNIYKKVNKKEGSFVADNVAGWDEPLFSDTLFGHKKGSFTGANYQRHGLLDRAGDGTLFLDEIGDLKLPLQTKLLRLIQEKKYFPIGSDKPHNTNARFIFATNKYLNEMKEKGEFRKDLFFRLNTHQIHLPPLRERKEDIYRLVDYFIVEASKEYNKKIPLIPDKLIILLSNHHFPGNIRELRSMVFEAVGLHQPGKQELSLNVFIKKIKEQSGKINLTVETTNGDYPDEEKSKIKFSDFFPTYDEMVKIYTDEAMKRKNNNQTKAAEMTGLDRSKFRRLWRGVKKKNGE